MSNRTTDNKQGQTCILVFGCQLSWILTQNQILLQLHAPHFTFVYRHDTKTQKKFINYQQFWVIFGQQSWEELQGWSKISSSKDTHGLLRGTASVASKGISSLTKQYSNKRKFIASCCLQMKTVSSSKRIKMYRTVYIESQNKVAHLFFPIFYA